MGERLRSHSCGTDRKPGSLSLSLSALGRFLVSWPALKAEDGCPPNQEVIPGPARTIAPKAGMVGMFQAGAARGRTTTRQPCVS